MSTSTTTTNTITVTCDCGKEIESRENQDGTAKTPRGWRRIAGVLTCPTCVKERYYVRAFRVEIRDVEGDRKEFLKRLGAASRAAARFGNWYVQQLIAADLAIDTLEKTKDGKDKLPKCPAVSYYAAAVAKFPELSGAMISTLGQMVGAWYRSRRFESLVSLKRSVESYRFGSLPLEIRKQSWSLHKNDEGHYSIRCQINPGKSWVVGVWGDRAALVRLRQIDSGEAIALACKIVRGAKRGPNGEPRQSWFFRVSAMFPRTDRTKTHKNVLTLKHDASRLLVGVCNQTSDVFEFPGVTLRKLIVGGDIADRRWQQEDSVKRGLWSRRKRERWARDRTAMAKGRQRKIKKQIELVADTLARWCLQHGVGRVEYDQTDAGFVPHFPWYQLKETLHNRLERDGIVLVAHATDEADDRAAVAGPGSETNAKV